MEQIIVKIKQNYNTQKFLTPLLKKRILFMLKIINSSNNFAFLLEIIMENLTKFEWREIMLIL